MGNAERRQAKRVSRQGVFQYKKKEANNRDEKTSEGLLVDYSIAGIRFFSNEQLEKNASLLIEFDPETLTNEAEDWRKLWQTDKGEQLQIIGSVMWCQKAKDSPSQFEVGTRFVRKA